MRIIQDRAKGGKPYFRIMATRRLRGIINYEDVSARIDVGGNDDRIYIIEFDAKDLLWLFGKMPVALLAKVGKEAKEGFVTFFQAFEKKVGGEGDATDGN